MRSRQKRNDAHYDSLTSCYVHSGYQLYSKLERLNLPIGVIAVLVPERQLCKILLLLPICCDTYPLKCLRHSYLRINHASDL